MRFIDQLLPSLWVAAKMTMPSQVEQAAEKPLSSACSKRSAEQESSES
jgi:hypothetical protein